MSGPIDPATGDTLPLDAIQRVLFICHPVHVYAIPPLMSMKGYTAADWTVPDPKNNGNTREIFTARLRILETAIPIPINPARPGQHQRQLQQQQQLSPEVDTQEKVKTDILLEDPNSGNLFAAAPYTDLGVVEHTLDSSRFFAVRVVGEGRKAVLGIGFEDRSEAFDFSVTLQEARKVLGFSQDPSETPSSATGVRGVRGAAGRGRPGLPSRQAPEKPEPPKDYSLKPGETISINIGRKRPEQTSNQSPISPNTAAQEEQRALFSIPRPPGPASSSDIPSSEEDSSGTIPLIPPPPSAQDVRADRRRRPQSTVAPPPLPQPPPPQESVNKPFDDDADFGDFQ